MKEEIPRLNEFSSVKKMFHNKKKVKQKLNKKMILSAEISLEFFSSLYTGLNPSVSIRRSNPSVEV